MSDCEGMLNYLFERDDAGTYWARTRYGDAYPIFFCPMCGRPLFKHEKEEGIEG